jgi:hypothetical protein
MGMQGRELDCSGQGSFPGYFEVDNELLGSMK